MKRDRPGYVVRGALDSIARLADDIDAVVSSFNEGSGGAKAAGAISPPRSRARCTTAPERELNACERILANLSKADGLKAKGNSKAS